jgi:hypothetical protein
VRTENFWPKYFMNLGPVGIILSIVHFHRLAM